MKPTDIETNERYAELYRQLIEEKGIVDYDCENPFVGLMWADLITVLDRVFVKIESWQLDEIKNCLQMARATLLKQTALDTADELVVKEIQNQSATTRYIDKCLKFLEK